MENPPPSPPTPLAPASASASAPDPVSSFPQPPPPVPSPASAPAPVPVVAPIQDAFTPNRVSDPLMHKNRLQEYTQRSSLPLPVYHTFNEGAQHAPEFRSIVTVEGVDYTSQKTFNTRKAAEQNVAKVALESILKKIKEEGCPLINEDTVFCKSILNEFAVKASLPLPTYNTSQSPGLVPMFVSSLAFTGATYQGEIGKTKKEAEQLAARAAIRSLLGFSVAGKILYEIIKSKAKLYDAVHKMKDPENVSKEDSAMHPPHHQFKIQKPESPAQGINFPIQFVRSSEQASCDAPDSSSAKKRKKNKKKAGAVKKLCNDAQSPAAAIPLNQASPCSVSQ